MPQYQVLRTNYWKEGKLLILAFRKKFNSHKSTLGLTTTKTNIHFKPHQKYWSRSFCQQHKIQNSQLSISTASDGPPSHLLSLIHSENHL